MSEEKVQGLKGKVIPLADKPEKPHDSKTILEIMSHVINDTLKIWSECSPFKRQAVGSKLFDMCFKYINTVKGKQDFDKIWKEIQDLKEIAQHEEKIIRKGSGSGEPLLPAGSRGATENSRNPLEERDWKPVTQSESKPVQ